MRAGSLKYTIKLLVSKLTSDSFGAKTEEWIVYADVRAGIIYKGGNKNISDYEMFNSSNIDFTMRTYNNAHTNSREKATTPYNFILRGTRRRAFPAT